MVNPKPVSNGILLVILGMRFIGLMSIPLLVIWSLNFSTNVRIGMMMVWLVASVTLSWVGIKAKRNSTPVEALNTRVQAETLGSLIDAEAAGSGEEKKEIQCRLTTALNAVQIRDGGDLSASQMENLYVHLDRYARLNACASIAPQWNAYPLGGTWERPKVLAELVPQLTEEYIDFLLSILTALGRIGDEDSIKHVNAILAGGPKSEQVERIQLAAEQCLSAIDETIKARRLANTLIRPSAEPVDPLLRPAQTALPPQQEVLLRPDDHN